MKKILIVEDQMLARKYLCSCIEKSTECEVASALTRADAALQRCGEGHIDLVVMDICTENDSDGLDAAEAIKKILSTDQDRNGDLHVRRTISGSCKENRSGQLLV